MPWATCCIEIIFAWLIYFKPRMLYLFVPFVQSSTFIEGSAVEKNSV